MCKGYAVLICFLGPLSPCLLSGANIPVANPSFEHDCHAPADIPGCISSSIPNGWSGSDATTYWPTAGQFPGGVPDGTNVAAVGGPNVIYPNYSGDLYQTLTVTLQANTTYTLSVYVGQRADFPLSGYTVSLEANSVVLASDSSLRPSPGTFLDDTIVYQSDSAPAELGQDLVINLYSTGLTASGAGGQVVFDDVSLQAMSEAQAAPEPSSFAPFGLCSLAFLAIRLRKCVPTL